MMRIRADRRVFAAAAIAVIVCLCLLLAGTVRSLRTENATLRSKQKDLTLLADETQKLKLKIAATESRKSLSKVDGVVLAVDEVVKSLGVGQKVKSVKPTGTRDRQYAVEEEAEVQFEKLSMNEVVNILYRLENAPMILSIKKATLKPSFDSPSLLNVSCTISLIKPK